MAIERERKFLVKTEYLPLDVYAMMREGEGHTIKSGYFTRDGVAIRVTLKNHGKPGARYKVCFKSPGGEERQEFEYTIPQADALALMELAPAVLTKERFDYEGWEIDRITVNHGTKDNPLLTDLWVAEWEEHIPADPQEQPKIIPEKLPAWIDREVTGEHDFSMQGLCWEYGRIR